MSNKNPSFITTYRGWDISVDPFNYGFIAKAKKDDITMCSGESFVFAVRAIDDAKKMIDKFESYR